MESAFCIVCGEPVDETNSSICNGCGGRYHLNQRNDRPGKDCGDVWINEQYLALEFGCANCLAAARGGSAADPPPHRPLRARRPRAVRRRYRKWES
ncbi:MAG TPA: hypothetical protein VNM43_04125 [Dehalococcoidia bacterium]|nr:hypothetical protein [Dehalococcoidia bacterium]